MLYDRTRDVVSLDEVNAKQKCSPHLTRGRRTVAADRLKVPTIRYHDGCDHGLHA